MISALNIVLGVLGSMSTGLLLAVLTGKLVPSSKVDAQARETEKWKASYQELRTSADKQGRLLERLVLTADITDKVMATIRAESPAGSD